MKKPIYRANGPSDLEAVTRALYAAGYRRGDLSLSQGIAQMLDWDGIAYVYVTEMGMMGRLAPYEYEEQTKDYFLTNSPAQFVRALKSR